MRPPLIVSFCLALAFPALLLLVELPLSLICVRLPVGLYLLAALVGAVTGPIAGHALRRYAPHSRAPLWLALAVVALGIGSALVLARPVPRTRAEGRYPPAWDSACGHRYCRHALAPLLQRSPFPLGRPDCSAWHRCANEAELSSREQKALRARTREQGCAEL